MKTILLISERIIGNFVFIEALKTVHKVDAISYVSTALHRLQVVGDYDLIIIEIGMPNSNPEAFNDSKSGLNFHREHLEKLGIPTIFWLWNQSNVKGGNADNVTFVLREHDDNHLLKAANIILEK